MTDIFGRNTTALKIKRAIQEQMKSIGNLNLLNVDPGEIVLFEDNFGKLRTSDIKISDLILMPQFQTLLARITLLTTQVQQLANDIKSASAAVPSSFTNRMSDLDLQFTLLRDQLNNRLTLIVDGNNNHINDYNLLVFRVDKLEDDDANHKRRFENQRQKIERLEKFHKGSAPTDTALLENENEKLPLS